MFSKLRFALALAIYYVGTSWVAASPKLGIEVSEGEIKDIDITVFPDGRGLPEGAGTAMVGKRIYATQCQACHGVDGKGAAAKPLAGFPNKGVDWSVGSAWPYATSIFDYTRRAMPPNNVKSLSTNEVYALTAYVLYLNGLISENQVVDKSSLAEIVMPATGYSRSKWQETEKSELYGADF